jgi:hypothetical protein
VDAAIEGALGEDGVIEEGDPFVDGPDGGHDGGGPAVALDDDVVEVTGLLGVAGSRFLPIDRGGSGRILARRSHLLRRAGSEREPVNSFLTFFGVNTILTLWSMGFLTGIGANSNRRGGNVSEKANWTWLVAVGGSLTVLALVAPGAPDFWKGVLFGFGAVIALVAVVVAVLGLAGDGRSGTRTGRGARR